MEIQLKPDKWLSQILTCPVFSLRYEESRVDTPTLSPLRFPELEENAFVFIKVPIEHSKVIQTLVFSSFKIIEVGGEFQKAIPLKESFPGARLLHLENIQIRDAKAEDLPALQQLSDDAFTESRFHKDPRISDTSARQIKKNWIESYFLGERGDRLFIAEQDGTVVGFNLLLHKKDCDRAIIDLIAVAPAHSRKGIGKLLLQAGERAFDNAKTMQVGTQLSNSRSVTFYQKNGFLLQRSWFALHYHHQKS